jgi:hypothetical protein
MLAARRDLEPLLFFRGQYLARRCPLINTSVDHESRSG